MVGVLFLVIEVLDETWPAHSLILIDKAVGVLVALIGDIMVRFAVEGNLVDTLIEADLALGFEGAILESVQVQGLLRLVLWLKASRAFVRLLVRLQVSRSFLLGQLRLPSNLRIRLLYHMSQI